MPRYGAFYQPGQPAYGGNPLRGQTWGIPQQDYIREYPDALNAWFLNQSQATDVGSRYHGFLRQWLGDQLTAYQGNQLVEPEQDYSTFLAGRNPWQDYEQQSLAPRAGQMQRWSFGPRQIRR